MIQVYNGLPDPKDDSAQGEEKCAFEMSEGEKSEDDSSKADADACTCFLRIINDFEDILRRKVGAI